MINTKKFCSERFIKFLKKIYRGYVNTLFGRRCWIPFINSENIDKRGFAERTAINTPIQGTSADITKISCNNISNFLKKNNLKTKMICQVHDEIVFDAPLDELEFIKPNIKNIMESAADSVNFSIPLTVDIEENNRWQS
jgi:DNA polymerase-1